MIQLGIQTQNTSKKVARLGNLPVLPTGQLEVTNKIQTPTVQCREIGALGVDLYSYIIPIS